MLTNHFAHTLKPLILNEMFTPTLYAKKNRVLSFLLNKLSNKAKMEFIDTYVTAEELAKHSHHLNSLLSTYQSKRSVIQRNLQVSDRYVYAGLPLSIADKVSKQSVKSLRIIEEGIEDLEEGIALLDIVTNRKNYLML